MGGMENARQPQELSEPVGFACLINTAILLAARLV